MNIAIRRASSADYAAARELLAAAELPVDDFAPGHLRFVAASGGELFGAVGLEAFGEVALLRSLVVAGDARSAGLGGRLVAALEDDARRSGIVALWLLTIDADDYFIRLGYRVRDRSEAPDAIRGTAEFSELCPGTAALMSKRLQGDRPRDS